MSTALLTKSIECPRLQRLVKMSVEYLLVLTTSSFQEYKRGIVHNCDCHSYENCPLKDKWDRCPVLLQFPQPYRK